MCLQPPPPASLLCLVPSAGLPSAADTWPLPALPGRRACPRGPSHPGSDCDINALHASLPLSAPFRNTHDICYLFRVSVSLRPGYLTEDWDQRCVVFPKSKRHRT